MKKKLAGIIALAILFLAIFYAFLSIDLFDSDFWWHVATGRFIVATGSLPDSDPFSYASILDENRNLFPFRENFILKQYWLGQVIFYLIFNTLGSAGIIILRSTLLTLTILIVLWQLRRWSVSIPLSFLFVFGLFTSMIRDIGERPVLFTILFSAVVFFILEDFRDRKSRRIFALIPVMLIWSNLHGGFIIGVVIISVFMLGDGIKLLLKKTALARRELILFYSATGLALCASWLNPTGWAAFLIAFSSKYAAFTKDIQEYRSPIFYYFNKIYPIDYAYVISVLLCLVILAVRNIKLDLIHILLLCGMLAMSLTSYRFGVYYVTLAAMVLGKEADHLLKDIADRKMLSDKIRSFLAAGITVACLVSAVLFAAVMAKGLPNFSIAATVPENAVTFIEKKGLHGNILNDFSYGGYMNWRLYPKKTFIDSRALNLQTFTEYGWIATAAESFNNEALKEGKRPLWKRLLEHYSINVIFLSILDPAGEIQKIIMPLIESRDWIPVYADHLSIIFVKNTDQNSEIIASSRLPADSIYNALISSASAMALINKGNVYPLLGIARTFHKMGRLEDAATAYRYAMKRLPKPEIQQEIDRIESEINARQQK